MSGRLFVSNSRPNGRTLEWESLPSVGEQQRHNTRARILRVVLTGVALFWGAVALSIASAVS